ncbi:hypothetical protein AMK58_27820 (plasmid) [Azospirillum brasilense]|nr:hypothetical protein AMK58_27820 [Azospirillum brasilense]
MSSREGKTSTRSGSWRGDAVVAGAFQLFRPETETLLQAETMPGRFGGGAGDAHGAGAAERPEQHAEARANLVEADRGVGMTRVGRGVTDQTVPQGSDELLGFPNRGHAIIPA